MYLLTGRYYLYREKLLDILADNGLAFYFPMQLENEGANSLLNQALEIYLKTEAKKSIEKIIAKKKLLTT